MLPALARQAIDTYSAPRDLVVDPMCGIGTTLVEAIHLGRRGIGVELEERWANLAVANVAHAHHEGAAGAAQIIHGDAAELPRLLAKEAPDLLLTSPRDGNALPGDPSGRDGNERARHPEDRPVSTPDRARARTAKRSARPRKSADNVARLPYGRVDLVLTSPPYACEVGQVDKQAWGRGGDLCPTDTRNYSDDRRNLGHARGDSYLAAMGKVYRACAAVLKPGGFLILVTKDMRAGGALRNLAGDTIALCEEADLIYWQHVIALLATIRDGELVPRPSFWQIMQVRRALARGERTHLVCHEDVLVFRKPTLPEAVEASATSTSGGSSESVARQRSR
jgi:hypothetical protein